MTILKKIFDLFYDHLITPVINSYSPVKELALGIGIGLFWGFTPLVGIQMYVVFMNWLIFKYVFRIKFDVLVGMAMVWISNPLTMVFMYYAFYVSGVYFMESVGSDIHFVTYESFKLTFQNILSDELASFWDKAVNSAMYLLYDLGFPMLIGCLFFAIPVGFGGYFISKPIIIKSRIAKAKKLGIPYEEWRSKFEKNVMFQFFKKPPTTL